MITDMFQKIQGFIRNKLNPIIIIVFGSYAKNSVHKQSDIDVAFYNDERTFTTYEIFQLAQELAEILKVEVDLIDLCSASTVFQAQIYTTGTVIYSANDTFLKNLQMTTLSMYAKLNEERRNIIKNIDESGSIYEK